MKRLIALTVTVAMLILPAGALAESRGPLTYDRSVAFMEMNSSTLKKLQRAEDDALRQYKSNVESAKNIDVNGFTFKYGNEEMYIHYGAETKLMMIKMKELFPEQMKFSWEATRANRVITVNGLKASLRGVFFGVYNAQSDYQLKQKQLALAGEINRQDKIKQQKGMITDLEMEESDFNLLKAQKDADNAKRSYDNMVRSFNQFVGLPARDGFSQVSYEDELSHPVWKPVEDYIQMALENRFDMISIRSQIALKEQEKKIIESGYLYKTSTTAQDEYERLLNDLEQLNLDLEGMRLSIINEIENAYVDVIRTGKSVDNLNNTLKLQRSSHANMQARFESGMISKNILTQSELGLLQVENGYKAALYDYNTRIMRFNNATGIGPGY